MSSAPPTRILIVEDELIIAADIVSRLTRLGYVVVGQADHAAEAIHLVGQKRPDLVLMDIRLQDGDDGVAAGDEIRRKFRLPVVYLTAHADEATLQRAKVTEPFGYVLKPFEERELRTVIEMARYKHAAERRLAESERRYATTLSSIGEAVVATDKSGRITFLNPVAERLTGWTLADASGRPLGEIFRVVDELSRQPIESSVDKVLASDKVVGLANSAILISRDNCEYPIRNCAAPIQDDDDQATGVVLVFRDITDDRKREDELRQAQKMDAIGRLAGGIAHDFNNLLTVIGGYCALLLELAGPEHPWRESIVEIARANQRAGDLTRQLLAFGRKQLSQPQIVNLNTVVSDSLKMISRLLPESVNLVVELSKTPLTLKVDPGQIEQMIVNLILNARDAMPQGGKLQVTTSCGVCEPGQLLFPAGGAYASLVVADTGVGMDAATKARVFEPFFTTKEVGKGTGLGLASVYGIVKQAQGHIDVKSAPGRGATFSVAFPFVPEDNPRAISPVRPHDFPRGAETILIVEDNEAIRGLAMHVLRSAGYNVLEARHGLEALEMVARFSGRIHLLISDIVMPQMSGQTLAGVIRSQIPGIRVLFITGYCDPAVLEADDRIQAHRVLCKPFAPKQLAAAVREVLDTVTAEDPPTR